MPEGLGAPPHKVVSRIVAGICFCSNRSLRLAPAHQGMKLGATHASPPGFPPSETFELLGVGHP